MLTYTSQNRQYLMAPTGNKFCRCIHDLESLKTRYAESGRVVDLIRIWHVNKDDVLKAQRYAWDLSQMDSLPSGIYQNCVNYAQHILAKAEITFSDESHIPSASHWVTWARSKISSALGYFRPDGALYKDETKK